MVTPPRKRSKLLKEGVLHRGLLRRLLSIRCWAGFVCRRLGLVHAKSAHRCDATEEVWARDAAQRFLQPLHLRNRQAGQEFDNQARRCTATKGNRRYC